VEEEGVDGSHAEAGVHRPGPVGGSDNFGFDDTHGKGHSLASIFLRHCKAIPSTLRPLLVSVAVTLGGANAGIGVVLASLRVSRRVQGRYLLLCEGGNSRVYVVDEIGRQIGVTELLVVTGGVEDLVEDCERRVGE